MTPSPIMEVTSSPCAVMAATPYSTAPETNAKSILYKIVTPYVLNAWLLALQHADLLHLFLNLVHDPIHSAPIGDLPLIPSSLTTSAQPTWTQIIWLLPGRGSCFWLHGQPIFY